MASIYDDLFKDAKIINSNEFFKELERTDQPRRQRRGGSEPIPECEILDSDDDEENQLDNTQQGTTNQPGHLSHPDDTVPIDKSPSDRPPVEQPTTTPPLQTANPDTEHKSHDDNAQCSGGDTKESKKDGTTQHFSGLPVGKYS